MIDQQLELSLVGLQPSQPLRANQRRCVYSAGWWFQRMRSMVDKAFDWQPAPPARPEQIWLPDSQRRVIG
jgi:hypothetical protein